MSSHKWTASDLPSLDGHTFVVTGANSGLGLVGALPTLYAATQKLPGASYVGPDGFQEQSGHPTLVGRSSRASDAETAPVLRERSEALTGVSFPL